MAHSGTLRSMIEDKTRRGPAQRALVRILETTIPDRAVWEGALRTALDDAHVAELPDEFDALLSFVRVHLVRYLDDEERPWIVSSLLEDLEAEAEVFRLGPEAASSARMAVATRIPDKLPQTEPAPADLEDLLIDSLPPDPLSEPHIPKLAPLPPDIAPPISNTVASDRGSADGGTRLGDRREPLPETVRKKPRIERPAVLVVDGDRFGRAALSRALVQGRCDVNTIDGRDEAIAIIEGTDPIDVLVLDVDAVGTAAILEALVRVRPEVPVVAWTNAAPAVAEHVTRVAGVQSFALLARSARPAQINETIRRAVDSM